MATYRVLEYSDVEAVAKDAEVYEFNRTVPMDYFSEGMRYPVVFSMPHTRVKFEGDRPTDPDHLRCLVATAGGVVQVDMTVARYDMLATVTVD